MITPKSVLIAGHRHLIIHGQLGNIGVSIVQMRELLMASDGGEFLPHLADIEHEVEYLKKVYPTLEGAVILGDGPAGDQPPEPKVTVQDVDINTALVGARFRDMRALVDAAYMSHTNEGVIDCHLKTMFDVAWAAAADALRIEYVDDIPF